MYDWTLITYVVGIEILISDSIKLKRKVNDES